MKEVESLNLHTDNAIVKQAEQKKKKQFIGSAKKIKGLNLYKINIETLEFEEPVFETVHVINKDKSVSARTMIKAEHGFMYVQAINKKNALRKVKNRLASQRT